MKVAVEMVRVKVKNFDAQTLSLHRLEEDVVMDEVVNLVIEVLQNLLVLTTITLFTVVTVTSWYLEQME